MYIDFFLRHFLEEYIIYIPPKNLLYLFVQIAIVRYIGGKIRRFIMMQPKDYSSFGCLIYMFNLRAFYSTPKSL